MPYPTPHADEPQIEPTYFTGSAYVDPEPEEAPETADPRLARALARVRRRQLQLALDGQVIPSARYARRAQRLRTIRPQAALTAATAVIALLIGAAPNLSHAQGPAPVVVRTGQVRLEQVQPHQRVTGSLRAVSRAAVAAQEEGAVLRVFIDEGDAVTQGQVLAQLDARRHEAQLNEAQAELTAAQAQVAEREADLVRVQRDADKLRELRQQNAATQREYDDALTAVNIGEAQLDLARRRVEQAAQRLALLKIRLDDTRVIAPFDGRVVQRHVEPGVWIRPGDAVATIVSSGRIEAHLEVPQRLAGPINNNVEEMSVAIDANGLSRRSLAIRPVPQVDPRVRTFAVIVELDNADEALAPGMSVSAWVPAGEPGTYTTVPKDAVIRSAQGAIVYLAAPAPGSGSGKSAVASNSSGGASASDPVAQAVPVKILFETADRVVVESDRLVAEDRVVIEGNERLRPATPLMLAAQH